MLKDKISKKHSRLTKTPDPHLSIHVSISKKLLTNIEENVEGDSRSAKLSTCAKLGYLQLTTAISTEISESE